MAEETVSFLFLSTFVAFLAISAAQTIPSRPVHRRSMLGPSLKLPANYTRVCDHKRYEEEGLKMADFAFCNSSLPFDVRAKDLVDRMTLEEKAMQMGNGAAGVPRLGIPQYDWWSEALHGVAKVGPGTDFNEVVPGATSFPQVILTAATFNQSLWKKMGQVVSTEARAMHNLGTAGLTFWSPNINLVRDPRWGRVMETAGEDPFVIGTYAINYVRGLQDIEGTLNTTDLNSRPLKVAACCKHYTAYDLDSWLGVERFYFDARVAEQDMLETFQKPFEMCIKEGDVSSAMCSFNNVNGIPSCSDRGLLNDVIRGEWNLHGYIVADCDSLDVIINRKRWLHDTPEDAVSRTLLAGMDLDCGKYYQNNLKKAVMKGLIKEADIERSLKILYVVLMRLGFFDGSPLQSLGKSDICSKEHIELAAEAARQGIVLLKNEKLTLPLNPDLAKKIAIVGPHGNATESMLGNYEGIPCRFVSPFDGLSAYGEVTFASGCENPDCGNSSKFSAAIDAAKNADVTVVVVGLHLGIEAEFIDRKDLLLPGYQPDLVTQVAEAAKGPVILVVMTAGVLDISFAKENPNIQAILWAGYPGEEGGRAIADIVFGKYNPGGRLPHTWYKNEYIDQIPMTSMRLRPDDTLGYPGRTYKFFNGTAVYPFGYGLSYTDFKYNIKHSDQNSIEIKLNRLQHCHNTMNRTSQASDSSCSAVNVDDLSCQENFEFEVTVENVGKRDGSEVVMVYSMPPSEIPETHAKQVIGFERTFVKAGESSKLKFKFNACKSLAIVDKTAYVILPSGSHTILVGDGDRAASLPITINFSR